MGGAAPTQHPSLMGPLGNLDTIWAREDSDDDNGHNSHVDVRYIKHVDVIWVLLMAWSALQLTVVPRAAAVCSILPLMALRHSFVGYVCGMQAHPIAAVSFVSVSHTSPGV